jgi:ribokinase
MNNKILVIGSSNTDMVLKTTRFPKPGETIIGGDFFIFQGGKGANQAVAAAKLGGNVSFICKVGNDTFGRNAVKHYSKEGIDISSILVDENSATGVAIITVNSEGENSIVVASGANALLSVDDLKETSGVLNSSNWILTQLETPITTIEYLADYCRSENKNLVLNPAPATNLPLSVYQELYLITPNETETELLTGIAVNDEASLERAVVVFKSRGVKNVIITLGSTGAYVNCGEFIGFVNAYKVNAQDTTAAGDIFNGALLVALSNNESWETAVIFASKAAAISVTRMGAQTSVPTRDEVQYFN